MKNIDFVRILKGFDFDSKTVRISKGGGPEIGRETTQS